MSEGIKEKPDDNGSLEGESSSERKIASHSNLLPSHFILEAGENVFHSHRYLICACFLIFSLLNSFINYLMSINNNLARLISSINASHRFDGFHSKHNQGLL